MKKINTYSTQYKIISHSFATANAQNFTHSSATANAEQLHNQNQNHGKNSSKPQSFTHKKTLSKDRQEFINNISASGFKQFNL